MAKRTTRTAANRNGRKSNAGGAAEEADGWNSKFSRLACETARLAGRPQVFLSAVAAVVVWALCGPFFDYSDTWQLVINTSTTIITFLMVFLIQNTQNRDTMALQLKLAELIFITRGAKDTLATAEDLSDEDLEKLHQEFRRRAEHAQKSLDSRRASRKAEAA